MARICVFDVNETLLDLSGLDPFFADVFGASSARQTWFTQVLETALVTTLLHDYADFTAIGEGALEMTAAKQAVELVPEERVRLLAGMRQLRPHADVRDGLERLRVAGLRLAALTNSPLNTAEAQLTHAGIRAYFEVVLSADEVRRLKPAPEPYHMAADRLGTELSDIRMIACHAWDIAGAQSAGCATAFVARPGLPYDPVLPRADIVATDLRDAAEQIVRAETRR